MALLEVKVHKVSQYVVNDRLNIPDRKLWISYFVQNCIYVPAFLQSHACSLLHNNPLLLPSNHITHRSLPGLYRRTSQSPQRLTLKIEPVIFVDTLKNIQHCTQIIPESRSYTYRNSMLNFVHICACWLHFLQVAKTQLVMDLTNLFTGPFPLQQNRITVKTYEGWMVWRISYQAASAVHSGKLSTDAAAKRHRIARRTLRLHDG